MKNQLAVVIVAADSETRYRLRAWLAGARGVTLIGEGDTEAEGLVLARERAPDVVLLDVDLWAAAGRREALISQYPNSRVLLLYRSGEEPLILAALRSGAAGCLEEESMTPYALSDALYAVARGEGVLSPLMAGLILDELNSRPASTPEPDR